MVSNARGETEGRTVSRPRLLDLFSGAGGAAVGYHRAGFDVTGVDITPQPRYPFAFVQADALEYLAAHGHEYDAIHASPPCQHYSVMRNLPWLKGNTYWDSIPPTRAALKACGRPWVIENVYTAPLSGIVLMGPQFGLKALKRRRFESSVFLMAPPHEWVREPVLTGGMFSSRVHDGSARIGCDWMTRSERSQAIPPAYTEYIGRQLLAAIEEARR